MQVLQTKYFQNWLIIIFLALNGFSFATPIKFYTGNTGSAYGKIGEKVLVPVTINIAPEWQTAEITFEVIQKHPVTQDAPPVIFEKIILDASTQAPYTAYVPVTVNGEGEFEAKGNVKVTLPEGKTFRDTGKSVVNFGGYIDTHIFAFEGQFVVGGGTRKMAKLRLMASNPEFVILSEKIQENTYSLQSETTRRMRKDNSAKQFDIYPLSPEERYRELFYQEEIFLRKKFYEKYPIKSPASSRALPVSLKAGDLQTIEVNWPIDAIGSSFLPLDGAKIVLIDNDGISPSIEGILNQGKFSFQVPKDNYSFTATVTAETNRFTIKSARDAKQPHELVQISFENQFSFNISPVINTDENLNIEQHEADSWSVFQAMVDLENLAASELSINKNGGYTVFANDDAGGSYYDPNTGEIHLFASDSFDWDVIAHEFGHAIASETQSTHPNPAGYDHDGSNQYDYAANSSTHENKERALSLAFNEGYGTWFGVHLLTYSSYKGKMPNVGDETYHDVEPGGDTPINLEDNSTGYYGEDTELALGALLWDLTDAPDENNTRAKCLEGCKDNLNISSRDLYHYVFANKANLNISVFYQNLYNIYVAPPAFPIDNIGVVNSDSVNRAHLVGSLFAEFGIAPNINEETVDSITGKVQKDNFKDIDNPLAPRPKIIWQQLKTGTMPGLDEFDLLIFNASKTELLYKRENIIYSLTGNKFEYQLDNIDHNALKDKLKQTKSDHIYIMLKARASAQGITKGPIPTGPYYSNAGKFEVPVLSKAAVIAVDSSGSNTWTDPTNMRNSAANSMLKKMADRNAVIRSGTNTVNPTELPTKVAAIDFDDYIYILSNFAEPVDLYQRSIFNLIDSSGGTDVARAINFGVYLIRPDGTPSPNVFPNQEKIYLLTDMDNGTGLAPIIAAVQNAGSKKIPVNIGHLLPITTFSNRSDFTELRGDHSPRLTRIAEPMDALTEVLILNGGSYATITDPTAQQAWIDLMAELNAGNPLTRTEINIPLDIKIYGVAVANDGRDEPDYVYTADQSGVIRITVDGKGNFIPTLTVNGTAGTQTSLGNDLYEMEFTVTQGQVYRINLNEAATDAGLYNIMLHRISAFATPDDVEPIPVMNVWFLISLIVSAGVIAAFSHRRHR